MDIVETIERLEVITDISPHDRTYTSDAEQYFFVGKSAVLTMIAATNARVIHAAGAAPIRTIVEFGAGYGRVTRWIKAAFPEADIHLVEGDEEALHWSCEKFGCRPLGDDLSGQRFDLIWAGAALAHSPQAIAESVLDRLTRSVGPGGILLFATHGRYSALRLQGWDWSRIDKPWVHYGLGRGIELALEGYANSGYGFAAYPDNDRYGISITRPDWYARRVTGDTEFTQLLFQEKGWDNHLDIHAYIRSPILSEERGPLKNVGFRTNVTFRRRPTRHLESQSTSTTDRTVSEAVLLERGDLAALTRTPFTLGTRPVIRWIKGDGLDDEITRAAIGMATRLFGDAVDYCLCTASLSAPRVRDILGWAAEPVEWRPLSWDDNRNLASALMEAGCSPDRFGYWWKWFPERVRPNAPEWILDGDMVVVSPPHWFDAWAAGTDGVRITQDDRPNDGDAYGEYAAMVNAESRLYSGLVSLPPGLRYVDRICDVVRRQPLRPRHDGRTNMSEQGVIATTFDGLSATPISLSEFPFASSYLDHLVYGSEGRAGHVWGYHFVQSFRRENQQFRKMQEDGRIFWRPTEPDIEERFRWLRNHRQWGSPGWSMVPDLAARITRLAKTCAGRNILELGTSRGFLSAMLAASGCFVTTVDKTDRGASANLQDLPVRCVHSDAAAYLRTQTSSFSLIVVDVHNNNERTWQELWPLLPGALEGDGLLVLCNSHLWQIPGREDESGLRWIVDNPPAGWSTEVFPEPLPGMILCRRA